MMDQEDTRKALFCTGMLSHHMGTREERNLSCASPEK